MGKLLVIGWLLLVIPVFVLAVKIALRPPRKARPDAVLTDQEMLAAAGENRVMLEQAIRVLGGILDDDADLAFLRDRRRSEATVLVEQYHNRQNG